MLTKWATWTEADFNYTVWNGVGNAVVCANNNRTTMTRRHNFLSILAGVFLDRRVLWVMLADHP